MKQLTNDTRESLLNILVRKAKDLMSDEIDIDEHDFECFYNGFGLFATLNIDYVWSQDGNEDETGPLHKNTIGEISVDFGEWHDRYEQVQSLTDAERKEIVVYLQANL